MGETMQSGAGVEVPPPVPAPRRDLIEALAEIEHYQWVEWSRDVAKSEKLSKERRKRWESFWVPYDQLPEAAKEQDRRWARNVYRVLAAYLKPEMDEAAEDARFGPWPFVRDPPELPTGLFGLGVKSNDE